MTALKKQIIDQVIAREGGYSDSAHDAGGATKYGITQKTARRHGYKGAVQDLPRAAAVEIYALEYWPASYDALLTISPAVTAELFDAGVNCGVVNAGKFLQRSLNVLNRGGSDYGDLKIDGVAGSKTVAALDAYLTLRRVRGEHALQTAQNALQGAYYIRLCERRPSDEHHIFGWLLHRITL